MRMSLAFKILLVCAAVAVATADKAGAADCKAAEATAAQCAGQLKEKAAALTGLETSLKSAQEKLDTMTADAQSSVKVQDGMAKEVKDLTAKADEYKSQADLAHAHSLGLKDEVERLEKAAAGSKSALDDLNEYKKTSVAEMTSTQTKLADIEKKYHATVQKLQEAELARDQAAEKARKAEEGLKKVEKDKKTAEDKMAAVESAAKAQSEDIHHVLSTIQVYASAKFARLSKFTSENVNLDTITAKSKAAYVYADENTKVYQEMFMVKANAGRAWAAETLVVLKGHTDKICKDVEAWMDTDETGKKIKPHYNTAKELVANGKAFMLKTAASLRLKIKENLPKHPLINDSADDIAYGASWTILLAPFMFVLVFLPLRCMVSVCIGSSKPKTRPSKSKKNN